MIDCLAVNYPGRTDPLPKRKKNGSGKFDQAVIPKPAPLASIPRRFKRYGMPPEVFRRLAREAGRPDVVMVGSVMTYWYTGVAEAVQEVRSIYPEVPVIVGGVYATLLPDHARGHTGADLVAVGDFRESLPPLLRELGLPDRMIDRDFFPAWDLYQRGAGAAIITGRGCPYRCPYCAVHVMAPELSRREPGAVVDEIELLTKDFNVSDVAFFDDSLLAGGPDHLCTILQEVTGRGLAVRFHAINALHLSGVTPELARLLKSSGFVTHRFGLETTDPARSMKLGEKANLVNLREAVSNLKDVGIETRDIGIYLLAGLPGQGPAEIEADIGAVLEAGARPYLSEYSPVPGSPMWSEAQESARFDISTEPLYHNNTLLSCADDKLDFRSLARLKAMTRKPFGKTV